MVVLITNPGEREQRLDAGSTPDLFVRVRARVSSTPRVPMAPPATYCSYYMTWRRETMGTSFSAIAGVPSAACGRQQIWSPGAEGMVWWAQSVD